MRNGQGKPRWRWAPFTVLLLLALSTACLDIVEVAQDDQAEIQPLQSVSGVEVDYGLMKQSMARFARDVAVALEDDRLRRRVYEAMTESPHSESKLHFRTILEDEELGLGTSIASLRAVPVSRVFAAADSVVDLELYMPVDEHRASWSGDGNIIVVSFPDDDGSQPVAFDLAGRAVTVSAETVPSVPALVLTAAETDFSAIPINGAGSGSYADSAWFMEYAHIKDDHEGWGMGDPEFEVHLFQEQPSAIVEDVICSGDGMPAPYKWDMNSSTWSGNVMLGTQAIIDTVHLEFQMWEDDNGQCDNSGGGRPPKTDQDVWNEIEAWAKSIVNVDALNGQTTAQKIVAWYMLATASYDLVTAVQSDDFVGVLEGPRGGCWVAKEDGAHRFDIRETDGGALKGNAMLNVTYGERDPLCDLRVDIAGPNPVYNCDPYDPTPYPAEYQTDIYGGSGSISSYEWREDGVIRGTASTYQLFDYSVGSRRLEVKVTRGGETATDVFYVTIQDEDPNESEHCMF